MYVYFLIFQYLILQFNVYYLIFQYIFNIANALCSHSVCNISVLAEVEINTFRKGTKQSTLLVRTLNGFTTDRCASYDFNFPYH